MSSSEFPPLGLKVQCWREFINSEAKPASTNLAGLATFHARFELASRFEGMSVAGMAKGTVGIYARAARIGLSYTALEYLEKVLGIKDYPEIGAPDLVASLRNPDFRELVDAAKAGFRSHAVKCELEYVLSNRSVKNIRPMVMLFRNSYFHGEFTAAGWKIKQSRANLHLLDNLAQVTLRKADETFTDWYRSNF